MNALYHHLYLPRSLIISNRIIFTKVLDSSNTHLPNLVVYGNSITTTVNSNANSEYLLIRNDDPRNDCLSTQKNLLSPNIILNLPRSHSKIRTFKSPSSSKRATTTTATRGEQYNHSFKSTNGFSFDSSLSVCLLGLANNLSQSPSYFQYLRQKLPKLRYCELNGLYRHNKENKQHDNNYNNNYRSSSDRKIHSYRKLMALSLFGIFGKGSSEDDKELTPLDMLIRKGAYCLMTHDYIMAVEVLHDALLLAQDDNNYEKEMLVNNLLAASYFENEDLVHAEKMFVEIIKRMLNNKTEPDDPAILELSLKLASIYSRDLNNHHKAEKGYKYVIDTLQDKLKDLIPNLDTLKSEDLSEEKKNQLALLGWGYDWLAKHHIGTNNMKEATKILKQAVEISSIVLGKIHDQTLILMNDVGSALAMSDSPEEGCEYIKKAVEGAKAAKSQELASFYANLGLIYLQMLKIDEAKFYCEKSLKLASGNRKHYNSKDVIAMSKNCLEEIQKLLKSNE